MRETQVEYSTPNTNVILDRDDDLCETCGHDRNEHHEGGAQFWCEGKTYEEKCYCEAFVLMKPEPKTPDEIHAYYNRYWLILRELEVKVATLQKAVNCNDRNCIYDIRLLGEQVAKLEKWREDDADDGINDCKLDIQEVEDRSRRLEIRVAKLEEKQVDDNIIQTSDRYSVYAHEERLNKLEEKLEKYETREHILKTPNWALKSFYDFHDLTVDDISRLNKRVTNLETTRNPQIKKIEERVGSLESFQSLLMACKQDAIARGAKAEDSVAATTPDDINYDPEWGKCQVHILGKEPCSCEVYAGIPMEHACCHSCDHPRNSHEKRSEAATVTTQPTPLWNELSKRIDALEKLVDDWITDVRVLQDKEAELHILSKQIQIDYDDQSRVLDREPIAIIPKYSIGDIVERNEGSSQGTIKCVVPYTSGGGSDYLVEFANGDDSWWAEYLCHLVVTPTQTPTVTTPGGSDCSVCCEPLGVGDYIIVHAENDEWMCGKCYQNFRIDNLDTEEEAPADTTHTHFVDPNKMVCGVCGETFDMRLLDSVLYHEHNTNKEPTFAVGTEVPIVTTPPYDDSHKDDMNVCLCDHVKVAHYGKYAYCLIKGCSCCVYNPRADTTQPNSPYCAKCGMTDEWHEMDDAVCRKFVTAQQPVESEPLCLCGHTKNGHFSTNKNVGIVWCKECDCRCTEYVPETQDNCAFYCTNPDCGHPKYAHRDSGNGRCYGRTPDGEGSCKCKRYTDSIWIYKCTSCEEIQECFDEKLPEGWEWFPKANDQRGFLCIKCSDEQSSQKNKEDKYESVCQDPSCGHREHKHGILTGTNGTCYGACLESTCHCIRFIPKRQLEPVCVNQDLCLNPECGHKWECHHEDHGNEWCSGGRRILGQSCNCKKFARKKNKI